MPLRKLLSKGAVYIWEEEQQKAFENLRDALLQHPVLRFPDLQRPFTLTTDASAQAIGGILAQEFEDGEHMVACASKQLLKEQRSYSVTELQCLAVVGMLRKFRIYLLGRPFTLRTDHKPLRWLLALSEPKPRLARWITEVSEYDFTIQHVPGKSISHADALPRVHPVVSVIEPQVAYKPVWDKARIATEQEHKSPAFSHQSSGAEFRICT